MDVDEAQQAAETSVVLLASLVCELNVLSGFLWSAIAAFYFVTVPAAYILVSVAVAACGCMLSCQSAAANMPTAIVGKFTLGSSFQCLAVSHHCGLGVSFCLCAGEGVTTGGRGRGPVSSNRV